MTERVGRENLVEANSRIALSDSSAQLIGPGLAGIFIHWLTAPFAILLDAIAFFTSAWMLKGIKDQASDAPKIRKKGATVWQYAKEGLRLIWNNPVLRSLAWGLAIWQFLKHMYFAIVILFAARDLALSPGMIGAVWMLGGVGFLIASFWVQHANRQFGVGRVMLGGLLATGLAWLLVALVSPGSWAAIHLGVAIFVLDLGAMLFFINYLTLRQSVTPDHLLGRVTSTMIFLSLACAPLGSLAGGAMAEIFGLRTTIGVAGAGGLLLCMVLTKFSPLSAMHELPTHTPEVPPAAASSQELAAE